MKAPAPAYSARALGSGDVLSDKELLSAPIHWPRPSLLGGPLAGLRGVGPATAEVLTSELGLETVGDMLFHLPRAYEEAPEPLAMEEVAEGAQATVVGQVGSVGRFQATGPPRGPRRRPGRLEVTVADQAGRGAIRAVWFNQPWLADSLKPGMRVRLVGAADRRGFVVSSHEVLPDEGEVAGAGAGLDDLPWRGAEQAPAEIHLREPVPVHPASDHTAPRQLRRLAWQALSRAEHHPEPLPARLRVRGRLAGAADALRACHFPSLAGGDGAGEEALRRLAFEELLLHQSALLRRRRERDRAAGFRLEAPGELTARWRDSLPFAFTADQETAIGEIAADLESGRPMQRLLMGEVGSGKTVVALAAMLRAVESGHQAALMAPTEVLAEQHAATIERLLSGTEVSFGLLTGSTPAARRRELLARLASGDIGGLIGTHALIEPPVRFASLALYVVDEQHRFGVRQRAAMDAKAPVAGGKGRNGTEGGEADQVAAPHALHMSATPIPRTLALLGYGDLDLSELRQLPAGRQPIETRLVGPERREAEFEELRERLRAGRQAYVVCPLIAESEAVQARAAIAEAERLVANELEGFRIAVLHGRLGAAEKREVMAAFVAGETDVLVATTVVEVGVDVPNATTIAIEGAERFGIAQLHQLRGRVGRGEHQSFCLLMAGEAGGRARRRLSAVAAQSDGFRLAELDLRLRGAGEILGARQHGMPEFRAARLPEHAGLLVEASREARAVLATKAGEDPGIDLLLALAEDRFGGVSERMIAA